MTDTTDESDPLWWFYQLTLNHQVEVLADPHQALPAQLVDLFASRPGVSGQAFWISSNWRGTGGVTLRPDDAQRLADYRDQLDYWWEHLSETDRHYFIEHRSDKLPAEYASKVRAATQSPLPETNPNVVVVVSDNQTGRFRLPKLVAVYVEMQARRDTDH